MKSRILLAFKLVAFLFLFICAAFAANQQDEPYKFFREYIGLNDGEINELRTGKAIAKVMESRTPNEVFVFGSVYVEAPPENYLKFALDIDALRKLPSYLAIRKFGEPPRLSDFQGFDLETDDIKNLKDCKPGHCDVQLPSDAMETFKRAVDWSAPDAAAQANRAGQQMAFQALQQYMQGGNTALGTYRDKDHPAAVAETFASLLSRSKALPTYLPDLNRFLLDYPKVKLDNVETEFYWEKVNFGLKPTLRIVQKIVYRGKSATEPTYAVAEKQLYASHYFETALDLTVCVRDTQRPNQVGFYLITLKGSQQAGLTGFKGGIVRKVAVSKTRSSLERSLVSIKQKLESHTN
jgi:hypothetical protein